MHNFRTLAAIAVALAILLPSAAMAGHKSPFEWEPITNADWNIAPDSAAGIHDAVMLLEKIYLNDKDWQDGECYRTVYQRVRILGETGRKWGDVEVPFLDIDQKIEEILGRTILQDGTIIELTEDQVFEKEVIKTSDEKVDQMTFSMPGVSSDCIVEYMITYKSPTIANEIIIQKEIPLLKVEYRWIIPELRLTDAGYDYIKRLGPARDFTTPNYLWLNPHSEKNITRLPTVKETKEVLFETTDVPSFEAEPHGLPEDFLKERILCYYGSSVAPAGYWGTLSSRIMTQLDDFCEKNKRVKKLAARLAPDGTDEEKIRAAYEWVVDSIANVSYEDLRRERGGHRGTKIEPKENENVDDIIKRGYGTSGDINRLFCDILREMNIDARLGLAKDRIDDLFLFQAKFWQFDRSVVAVPTGLETYDYYTPGYSCTPAGMTPWFLEGIRALIGNADEYLMLIPFSPSSASMTSSTAELTIDDNLKPSGTVKAQLTGHDSRAVRVELLDEQLDQHESILRELLADSYPEADIDSISIEGLEDLSGPVVIRFHVEFPALSTTGGKFLLQPFGYLSEAGNVFSDPDRTGPILMKYAYQTLEVVKIHYPEGWTVEAVPQDTTFGNVVGLAAVQVAPGESEITAQRNFSLNVPFWQPENYGEVKDLYTARQALSELMVVLSQSPAGTGPASTAAGSE